MSIEQMQLFTAVLALSAATGSVLYLLLRLLAPWVPAAARLGRDIEPMALTLAAVIAVGATLGSLYFSEIANYAPCKLCWFQRIFIYPQAVILSIAAVTRDRKVWRYSVPLSVAGLAVASYHYLIEWVPTLEKTSCALDTPCTAVWFRSFGFVSLALMAALAFLSVTVLTAVRFPGEPDQPADNQLSDNQLSDNQNNNKEIQS